MAEVDPEGDWKSRWSVKRNRPFSLFRTTQSHPFLCLPPEMREHIWTSLDSKAVQAMREVCALFKFDMEQVLGVNVIIKRIPVPRNSSRNQGIAHWLQTVIVRRLELSYTGRKRMNYSVIVLKNPFMLRELVLKFGIEQFGDPAKVENLKRLLNCCTRLSSLHVEVRMDSESSTDAHFEGILSETLACLDTKGQLKDFGFSTSGHYSVSGFGYRIVPDPAYAPRNIRLPTNLRTLSLQAPLATRSQHLDWQALLSAQTQLVTLNLKVGRVSWHFFQRALSKSAPTLRAVSVEISRPNHVVRGDEDFRPELSQFGINYSGRNLNGLVQGGGPLDWSVFSTGRLESLTVVSPWQFLSFPHDSYNFDKVKLSVLTKIEIRVVHLTFEDLTRIFIQGTKLTSINLSFWTLEDEQNDGGFCLMLNIKIWILIAVALQSRRFSSFSMYDRSLIRGQVPAAKSIVSAVRKRIAPQNTLSYNNSGINLRGSKCT